MLVLKEESLFGRFFCNWDFILGQDGFKYFFPIPQELNILF